MNSFITDALKIVHGSWHDILQKAINDLIQKEPLYFESLEKELFFPTNGRLFAAFSQPFENVQYILVGEGPYPREKSATGYAFMDGAVGEIWTDVGFEKAVSKATSLRNFLKMLLVAEGLLSPENTKKDALEPIAKIIKEKKSFYIQHINELQQALHAKGFLLLNSTLVFRKSVSAAKESKIWQPFFKTLIEEIYQVCVHTQKPLPTFILWGKNAENINQIAITQKFPQVVSEHPYNLSFIHNVVMQNLFAPMHLLIV